jgi:glutaredoxin 3
MTAPLIEMYTTSWCPYCTRAKRLLEHKAASYAEISIEEHPERRTEMIQRSGRRTVPQIFIDGHHIGGSDELAALDAAGGLDRLLSPARAAAQ